VVKEEEKRQVAAVTLVTDNTTTSLLKTTFEDKIRIAIFGLDNYSRSFKQTISAKCFNYCRLYDCNE
jgi:hypothetical protein